MAVFVTTIRTRLPLGEARARIAAIVEVPASFWARFVPGPSTGAPFTGKLGPAGFKIVRVITYRNSFLPVVRGALLQGNAGADVRLVMTLHPLVAMFMVIWFGGLAYGAFRGIESGSVLFVAVPALMCLFGIGLVLGGFIPEAIKAKDLLRQALVEAAQQGDAPVGRGVGQGERPTRR